MTVPARVLVLLAARNGQACLGRQLDTVLAQKGVLVRVDVRDDGSTDATRELVAGYAAGDDRVRLVPGHEASGSAAGNFFQLIRQADVRGVDLVAFCDQDDEWFLDKLARAAAALAATGADGGSAAVRARWPDGRERDLGQNPSQRLGDYLFEGAGQGCTFVMTVQLFERVRAMVDRAEAAGVHYHDWTVYAIARAAGLRWHFDPEPVMTYRQHAGNDTGARSSLAGVARRLAAIRDGWYRTQVDAMASLVLVVAPDDPAALRWRALAQRRGVSGRLGRAAFVLQHGRRRPADRLVQAAAALAGHL